MKYLEECKHGDRFTYNNGHFILTTDFKKNGDRLAINLHSGSLVWINSQAIVEGLSVFTIDKDNNIIPL
jgi:hypothetical protein